MKDNYDIGYSEGVKNERRMWKLRVFQAGFTAATYLALHFLLPSGRTIDNVVDNGSNLSQQSIVSDISYMSDESDPNKYNPNSSSFTDTYSRGTSVF